MANVEVDKLRSRKAAAKSALRYFTDIKSVRSTNNPFARTTTADLEAQYLYRKEAGWFEDEDDGIDVEDENKTGYTVAQTFENASHFGIGNCGEKAMMCYGALKSNPRISGSAVSCCSAVGYDHAFCVVSDSPLVGDVRLKDLDAAAIIVDGWTEDWYFPRLSWTTAKWYKLGNTPNPRQLYVRTQIERHRFRADAVTDFNDSFQSRGAVKGQDGKVITPAQTPSSLKGRYGFR